MRIDKNRLIIAILLSVALLACSNGGGVSAGIDGDRTDGDIPVDGDLNEDVSLDGDSTDGDDDPAETDDEAPARDHWNEGVPAAVDLPAPQTAECLQIGEGEGTRPAVFGVGGEWHVFRLTGEDNLNALMHHRAPVDDPVFDEGEPSVYAAAAADLREEENGALRLLAVRETYKFEVLRDTEGAWSQEVARMVSEDGRTICPGWEPALFASGDPDLRFLTFDYDTGIFGCGSKVYLADAGEGERPALRMIGLGWTGGAYRRDGVILITSGWIYRSEDDGGSFVKLQGGDDTATSAGATGLASFGDKVLLLGTAGYASVQSLYVLVSRDGGRSITERVILDSGGALDYYFSPAIASEDDDGAVVWTTGDYDGAYAMVTPDAGETWSELAFFSAPVPETGRPFRLAVHQGRFAFVFERARSQPDDPRTTWFCSGTIAENRRAAP